MIRSVVAPVAVARAVEPASIARAGQGHEGHGCAGDDTHETCLHRRGEGVRLGAEACLVQIAKRAYQGLEGLHAHD